MHAYCERHDPNDHKSSLFGGCQGCGVSEHQRPINHIYVEDNQGNNVRRQEFRLCDDCSLPFSRSLRTLADDLLTKIIEGNP